MLKVGVFMCGTCKGRVDDLKKIKGADKVEADSHGMMITGKVNLDDITNVMYKSRCKHTALRYIEKVKEEKRKEDQKEEKKEENKKGDQKEEKKEENKKGDQKEEKKEEKQKEDQKKDDKKEKDKDEKKDENKEKKEKK